jgi:radical SAM protein with 4Fe4S-binding SPASM domain
LGGGAAIAPSAAPVNPVVPLTHTLDTIHIHDLTQLAKRQTIPISVLVEVCRTCNEDCIHCCLADHNNPGLTLQQYDDLFDQLAEAGTFFVILTGGEPFTRPDFLDIVAAARRRRLATTIFTNGTLLNDTIIAALARLYVQEVHVSIYSADATTHDRITSRPGSFAKTIHAIERLRAHGVTTRIKCPLMSLSAAEIKPLKHMARTLGVDIRFTIVITAKDTGDQSTLRLRLDHEQLRAVLPDPEVNPQSDTPLYCQENLSGVPCDAVFNGGAIDPNGDVYVCNQLQIRGGNVLTTRFKEIWNHSDAFRRLRALRLSDLTACRECQLFPFCTRCPGLAHLEDGDVTGCSSAARMVAAVRAECQIHPTQTHIFSSL